MKPANHHTITPRLIRGTVPIQHGARADSTELHGTDYLVGFAALILCSLGGYAFAWLTTPTEAPEPHYCFRADPPPCQMSVQP